MIIRLFSTWLLVFSATGCAASIVPSRTPTSSPALAYAPASVCATAGLYELHGSCTRIALQKSGGFLKLAAYKGFSLTWLLPANTAPAGTAVSLADATGHGDITGEYKSRAFPLYPSPCASRSCPGKAILYLNPDIVAKTQFSWDGDDTLSITSAAGFPGQDCYFAGIESRTKFGWVLLSAAPVHPQGKTLRVSAPPSTVPGPAYLAVACK